MRHEFVALGRSAPLNEIGSYVADNKILMVKYDWKEEKVVGIWITPEKYDELVNDPNCTFNDCVINPVVVRNGEKAIIPKGNYEIWMVSEIR